MSYDKIQSLSMKKDGTLSIRCAASNMSPVIYETVTLPMKEGETPAERLNYVYRNLASGSWRMNPSNKSLIYYYFLKSIEDVEQREQVMIQFDRYEQTDQHSKWKQAHLGQYAEEVWQAFQKRCLEQEKVNVSEAVYAVKNPNGTWMHAKNKRGYSFSGTTPKYHPIVKAELYKRMYDGKIVKKEE